MLTFLITLLVVLFLILVIWRPAIISSEPLHRCKKCNSIYTKYSYHWARGYNNLCKQSYGDYGWYCTDCSHVEFKTSLEEHRKYIPEWCIPYR